MIKVSQTETFANWLKRLRDANAKARILTRINRLKQGNAGDVKAVGEGVSEMRIDYGPGYRVYYKGIGVDAVLLLAGGDKDTQDADIAKAKAIAQELGV